MSFTVWVFVFPVDFFFLTLLPLRVAPVLTALPLLLAAALLEGKLSHAALVTGDLTEKHGRVLVDFLRHAPNNRILPVGERPIFTMKHRRPPG